MDRLVFAALDALAPNVFGALEIVKPDTLIRWHRAGFRAYGVENMRILGDLDLVPTNRTTDAYAALVANGFSEKPGYGIPPDCHHLPVLHEH